jgi:hypothetical protein
MLSYAIEYEWNAASNGSLRGQRQHFAAGWEALWMTSMREASSL